ncbi:two-component response regulator ORR26-like [Phaseolus vulgaris]|uniref:two-component response regulator ORR26-like n=1 Tax=Phaseolus vulgaris TaxID=3885 RepID=UPI0035CA41FE
MDNAKSNRNRMLWTRELHAAFLSALQILGPEAGPKRIQEIMNIAGLTTSQISSHLQKYRIGLKKNQKSMEMVALPPPSDMNGENSDQDYFQEASNDPEYSDNPQQDAPSRDHQPDAPTGSLFGKLREHELEINRLNIQESEDKHVRNIALKTAKHKNNHVSSDESEGETLSLLSKKFIKFLKKNHNKDSNKERYDNKKTSDFNANNYTCYGCGEQGHIKVECPNKEKKSSKKEKKEKSKSAYIAWDENDISLSSASSSEDEEANMCLMAKEEDDARLLRDQGVLSHKIKLIKGSSGLPITVLYQLSLLGGQEKILDHGQ